MNARLETKWRRNMLLLPSWRRWQVSLTSGAWCPGSRPTASHGNETFFFQRLEMFFLVCQPTSQQYFSLIPNQYQPPTNQQYFSLITNQYQPSAQPNRVYFSLIINQYQPSAQPNRVGQNKMCTDHKTTTLTENLSMEPPPAIQIRSEIA